jgi:prevent-host-death family protein
MYMAIKKMTAVTFKARCLAVVDEVRAKRQTVLITKHGKPIAKLVPADESKADIFNFMAGQGRISGDIVSPALTPDEWGLG